MDPNVARLIERTRARRAGLKEGSVDGSPLPSERERSPLKERNSNKYGSPGKQQGSPGKLGNLGSPNKRDVPITLSPAKSKQAEESPSNTIRRILSRGSLENNVQELLHRGAPGTSTKMTTVTASTPGSKTITKTVITEKEERFEKKEIISYSGNAEFMEGVEEGRIGGEVTGHHKSRSPFKAAQSSTRKESSPSPSKVSSSSTREANSGSPSKVLSPLKDDFHTGRKARLANLASKFKQLDDEEEEVFKEEVKLPRSPEKPPVRAPSPTKHAPVKMDHLHRRRSPSPTKATNPMQFVSPRVGSPVKSASVAPASPVKTTTESTPTGGFKSILATKASVTVASNSSPIKNTTPTGYRAPSPTKQGPTFRSVSPAKVVAEQRAGSPTKLKDQGFITSLKAQGFEETSSKSKLVYNFEKKDEKEEERSNYADNIFLKNDEASKVGRDTVGRRKEVVEDEEEEGKRDQLSPMRDNMVGGKPRERSPSPVKTNIFLARDQARCSVRGDEERGRSGRRVSPGRALPRSESPRKQQTTSEPSPIKERAKPTFGPSVPSTAGPPKPSRTFQATPADREEHPTDTLQAKSLLQKRSMFEGNSTPAVESPDPSCIPLSQRKALFEKIKSVPTPIARFGDAVTPAMLAKKPTSTTMVETPSEAWKRKRAVSPMRPPSPSRRPASPIRRPLSPQASKVEKRKEVEQSGAGIGEARRLFSAATPATPDWRENEIAKKAAQEKQAEMDILLNRYKHLRQPEPEQKTSPKKATSSSKKPGEEEQDPKYYPGVNSMKRVRVSPPKEGQLYPQIDFDSDRPESVMSSDTLNDSYESQMTNASEAPSLGKHIMAAASRQQTAEQQELSTITELHSDSMETDEGDGLTDSVLEAALDDEDDQPTPPKVAKTSSTSSSGSDREGAVGRSESTSSWEYHTPTSQPRSEQKFKTPMILTSPGPASPKVAVEGEDGPLLHTVSFYRAQKPPNTPVARVTIEPRIQQSLETTESPRATISQKILRLQEEAAKQMPVIQQASQALNLCRSTKEFFGSSEQVEGERLLLEASHKRAAALTEIQALKTEGGIGADPRIEASSVRGTVSLCGITLGLKKEFVQQVKTGLDGDFVHFFVCLVKCSGQVIPTTMVATADGLEGNSLHFPNLIKFRDLSKDFAIHLEVYGLQTRREVLGHEAKYHISGPNKPGLLAQLTPKMKFSKTESRLARPPVASPGGPQAVRTSSFAMVGQTVITLGSLGDKGWRLSSVPQISPLEGTVHLTLNGHSESQVTHRGFLTMFHDVSGSGAWKRWWMLLEGSSLSYWTYPDDEAKKEPVGWIDLAKCSTELVSLAPRDICSRAHTFMMETEKPATREDKESLVVIKVSREKTKRRHLLSADSRVERLTWCDMLTRALDNLRAWDTSRPSRAPSDDSLDTVSQASSQSTEIW